MLPAGHLPSGRIDRRALLALAAAGAGFLVACGDEDEGDDPEAGGRLPLNDAEIASLLLRVERAEEAVYDTALDRELLSGEARELADRFRDHEREHIQRLEEQSRRLGAEPSGAGGPPELTEGSALVAIADLEALSSGAYLGLMPRARDRRLRSLLVAIHSTEAQHAAVVRRLAGREYTPDGPFAQPVGTPEVRRRLEEIAG